MGNSTEKMTDDAVTEKTWFIDEPVETFINEFRQIAWRTDTSSEDVNRERVRCLVERLRSHFSPIFGISPPELLSLVPVLEKTKTGEQEEFDMNEFERKILTGRTDFSFDTSSCLGEDAVGIWRYKWHHPEMGCVQFCGRSQNDSFDLFAVDSPQGALITGTLPDGQFFLIIPSIETQSCFFWKSSLSDHEKQLSRGWKPNTSSLVLSDHVHENFSLLQSLIKVHGWK